MKEGSGRAARGSEAGEEEKNKVNASGLHRNGNGWNNALCSAHGVWRTDNAETRGSVRVATTRPGRRGQRRRMKEWREKKRGRMLTVEWMFVCSSPSVSSPASASPVPSLFASLSIQLSARSEHLLGGSTMGCNGNQLPNGRCESKSTTNGGQATAAISSLSDSDEGSRRRV